MTGDVVELTMDEAVAVKKRHRDEGVRDLGKAVVHHNHGDT